MTNQMALHGVFQVGPVHGPACWLVIPMLVYSVSCHG